MTERIVGATIWGNSLESIRVEIGTIQDALIALNKGELTRAQLAHLMVIQSSVIKVIDAVSTLEKFGESVRDIDRAIKRTGELKVQ